MDRQDRIDLLKQAIDLGREAEGLADLHLRINSGEPKVADIVVYGEDGYTSRIKEEVRVSAETITAYDAFVAAMQADFHAAANELERQALVQT